MLNGNLYQESPEKNGLVGRISEEEQAQFRFEKIGTIQKEVAHNRLPVEDFMSNFGSVGADVYLSSDGQHAYLKVEKGYLRFDLWKDNTRAVYELTYPGMV